MLYFEWDGQKARENRRNHKVSFEAASAALEDPFAIEEEDLTDDGEQRLRTVGMAEGAVVVVVIHVDRTYPGNQDVIARIISARKATPGERREYDQHRAQIGGNTAQ